MSNKMFFLSKMSLRKKIKTKWFLIANILFAILIIGAINIDKIIVLFGGDFSSEQEIMVIDEAMVFDSFKDNYLLYSDMLKDTTKTSITKFSGSYDEGVELIEEDDNRILLVISKSDDNYIKAKAVSKSGLGITTNTFINSALSFVKSEIVLNEYNITSDILMDINKEVDVTSVVLSDKDIDKNMTISTVMQIITLPLFLLIIYLVQMIGAEVNEEKSTKSMEIIISNVSPKTHFISKIISSNVFVFIQGLLLVVYAVIGVLIRYIVTGGKVMSGYGEEVTNFINTFDLSGLGSTLGYMIPIMLVIIILTFIAYSLLAGILASMTTNLEDYQQLQTPIIIISLVGYYLSMMGGMFKGSVFIRIMSYVPFISSMLAPSLFVMGEITVFDLAGSILLLILTIRLLIKYGLRIYKVGILNYSQNGLWKKMFKAVKENKE